MSRKHLNKVVALRQGRARRSTVQPGIVLDQLNAWLKPHGLWYPVDVSTSAQARSAAWPATIPAARARSATATWCTTCARSTRCWPTARAFRFDASVPEDIAIRRSARYRRSRCAAHRRARSGGDRAHVPEGAAPGRRLQPRHDSSRSRERPYTTDNSVNMAHLLVGSRRHARVLERADARAVAAAEAQDAGRLHFPSFYKAMEAPQHIVKLRPDGGRAGRPHDDRARARQPRVPADRSSGSSAASPRRSCWSSSPATSATSSCAS